jgi:hypothetical protein
MVLTLWLGWAWRDEKDTEVMVETKMTWTLGLSTWRDRIKKSEKNRSKAW